MSKEVTRYSVAIINLHDAEPMGMEQRVVLASDFDALLAEKASLESAWKVDVLNRKDELIAKQEQENDRVKAELAALLAERDGLREDALRCEGCGYMTHHREHMGCVSAAKLGRPSLREMRMLDALEYALPYLEACVPNPRNGVNHDGSVDVNCVQRVRDAIASAALQGEQP